MKNRKGILGRTLAGLAILTATIWVFAACATQKPSAESDTNLGTAPTPAMENSMTEGAATDGQEEGTEMEVTNPQKISPEQALSRMKSGDPLVILDVRSAEEYETAHIPGAVLLPNEEIGTEQPALLPDFNQEILVYCRSGHRSGLASQKLADMGYTRVYDFGGIIDLDYYHKTGHPRIQKMI